MTLTLEIWPWVKVMTQPLVMDNICVKYYPDPILQWGVMAWTRFWTCVNCDLDNITVDQAELQIIFEPNAYLPPTFWLNADFQNLKWYFHPLYFFEMLKRQVLLFFSVYLQFCVILDISFVVICLCCGIILQTLGVTQRKPLTICWQTDRQMDLFNPEFYFCFSFDNCYALLSGFPQSLKSPWILAFPWKVLENEFVLEKSLNLGDLPWNFNW